MLVRSRTKVAGLPRPSGGIGRHASLKKKCLRAYGFDSRLGYVKKILLIGGPYDGQVRDIADHYFSRGIFSIASVSPASAIYAVDADLTEPININMDDYFRAEFAVGKFTDPIFKHMWFHTSVYDADVRNAALGSLFASFFRERLEGYVEATDPRGGLL